MSFLAGGGGRGVKRERERQMKGRLEERAAVRVKEKGTKARRMQECRCSRKYEERHSREEWSHKTGEERAPLKGQGLLSPFVCLIELAN